MIPELTWQATYGAPGRTESLLQFPWPKLARPAYWRAWLARIVKFVRQWTPLGNTRKSRPETSDAGSQKLSTRWHLRRSRGYGIYWASRESLPQPHPDPVRVFLSDAPGDEVAAARVLEEIATPVVQVDEGGEGRSVGHDLHPSVRRLGDDPANIIPLTRLLCEYPVNVGRSNSDVP